MARQKRIYICTECGHGSPKWLGRCPECGSWDSFQEQILSRGPEGASAGQTMEEAPFEAVPVTSVDTRSAEAVSTGLKEFDRVLGGGLVPGAVILLAGAPGIGKSTLLLQALSAMAAAGRKVLYVSGEESASQIALRARRLGGLSQGLLLMCDCNAAAVVSALKEIRPDVLALDSIQTMHLKDAPGLPGSTSQVRHCSSVVMDAVKELQIPAIFVGHVTKQGGIAGPMLLEHMVDTVLSFQGERTHAYRVLRAVKNRYGSVSEIGIFEMTGSGLKEVEDPSGLFVDHKGRRVPGSVVTVCMEGSRPILVEIQALVNRSYLAMPRRTTAGVDSTRLALLTAVAERHLGLSLFDKDIFINVVGGLKVNEPAVDLPIILAVCSSLMGSALADKSVLLGEVGLTGEIRPVPHVEQRISEAARLGFTRCLVPAASAARLSPFKGMEIVPVATIQEAKSYVDGKG